MEPRVPFDAELAVGGADYDFNCALIFDGIRIISYDRGVLFIGSTVYKVHVLLPSMFILKMTGISAFR